MIFADLALNFAILMAEGGTGAEAAHHKAAPPLAWKIDTSIFTLVIFLVLLAILFKYAWKPIMEGLEKRENSMAEEIAMAKSANEKAQQSLRDYEGKLAAATEQINVMLAEARKDAETIKDKIVADANEEAQRQRDRAIADIDAAKDAAVRDLAQRSVDSAVSLAGSLVKKEIDAKSHSKLIDESLDQFARSN